MLFTLSELTVGIGSNRDVGDPVASSKTPYRSVEERLGDFSQPEWRTAKPTTQTKNSSKFQISCVILIAYHGAMYPQFILSYDLLVN